MSFQQGLSGLNASSKNLEVIGNNIANANTYGAKTSRAEFSHLYTNSLGDVTQNAGIGVRTDAVAQLFTQGGVTDTNIPTDLAITGSGFFQVSDGVNPTLYTRNGQFKVNSEGEIVNNDGLHLLGYPTDVNGVVMPGVAQALKLPTAGLAPQATSKITMELNLNSNAEVIPAATTFSPTNPASYNNATSQTVYDSKGQGVTVTYYFRKTADDAWSMDAYAGSQQLTGAPFTLNFVPGTGQLDTATSTFPTDIPSTTTVTGTATQPITLATPSGFDGSNLTQVARAFSVTKLDADGNSPASIAGVNIQNDGTVMAVYSNGKSIAAGQIELANFRNPQGLQPLAGNVWAATPDAGNPTKGTPNNGVLGKLQSGALEESNVDIAAELVNMITAQRAYQANAQTIKTQDQVMQTLVNLK
jgi:flagellar hook protein FlgE